MVAADWKTSDPLRRGKRQRADDKLTRAPRYSEDIDEDATRQREINNDSMAEALRTCSSPVQIRPMSLF
jgi:hypothetical protein